METATSPTHPPLRVMGAALGCPPMCQLLEPGSEMYTHDEMYTHQPSQVGTPVPISQIRKLRVGTL